MSKNVAVFVDVANIFYAAKAAGIDIDYVTLLKSASAGRDLVRAYAYTGLDPDNENQRNFHDFLRRNGYRVVSKDIRKYGDGKVKANLDIELVVDLMKTSRNLDVAVVVSGDGDFAPAIRAVQEMGVRVEVICFRANTSSDLIDVADLFTEIANVARVEKGSTRSGRRVATDEEDLSMTEVPDKLSEGTGRGRGRTRTRTRTGEAEAAPRARTRTRAVAPEAAPTEALEPVAGGLVALPGEKLSKAAAARLAAASTTSTPPVAVPAEADAFEDGDEALDDGRPGDETGADGEARRRRRRRRGGRGRGRGREHEGAEVGASASGDDQPVAADDEDDLEPTPPPAPARRRAATFGTVWDSQLGTPTAAPAGGRPLPLDEEDLDEPPIPEYLIAERRQRSGGGVSGGRSGRGPGGPGRGTRGAYAAAMDRERFGGGRSGGGGFHRPEPAPRGREEAFVRPGRPRSSDEPWSEVPPELEAMLRAQLAAKSAGRPASPRPDAAVTSDRPAAPSRRGRSKPAAEAAPPEPAVTASADAEAPAPKRRATRKTATVDAPPPAIAAAAEVEAPKRRTTRRPAAAPSTGPSEAAPPPVESTEAPAPRRRANRTRGDAPA